eukprot:TRINITY_DN9038_c0_g1_i1.p4 TRINITY_DN9038_c0_g1~~TRINITY_DN9038_c0_g1_i1.p4  ORF type:complete len:216 (+),score=43.04 TRINITY_DN9038_c0_g1_i1:938-1585(+)
MRALQPLPSLAPSARGRSPACGAASPPRSDPVAAALAAGVWRPADSLPPASPDSALSEPAAPTPRQLPPAEPAVRPAAAVVATPPPFSVPLPPPQQPKPAAPLAVRPRSRCSVPDGVEGTRIDLMRGSPKVPVTRAASERPSADGCRPPHGGFAPRIVDSQHGRPGKGPASLRVIPRRVGQQQSLVWPKVRATGGPVRALAGRMRRSSSAAVAAR